GLDSEGGGLPVKVEAARSGITGISARPSKATRERFVDTDSKALQSVAICLDKYSSEKYLALNAMPAATQHHAFHGCATVAVFFGRPMVPRVWQRLSPPPLQGNAQAPGRVSPGLQLVGASSLRVRLSNSRRSSSFLKI